MSNNSRLLTVSVSSYRFYPSKIAFASLMLGVATKHPDRPFVHLAQADATRRLSQIYLDQVPQILQCSTSVFPGRGYRNFLSSFLEETEIFAAESLLPSLPHFAIPTWGGLERDFQ